MRDELVTEKLDNNFLLKPGDKILLNKALMDNFNLTKSNSVSMPMYDTVGFLQKNDTFFEQTLAFTKTMILKEEPEYLILNKHPNVSSQGGKHTKVNLVYLINTYLHRKNQNAKSKADPPEK